MKPRSAGHLYYQGVTITQHSARSTMTTLATEALAMGSKLELLEAEARQLTAGERAAFAQLLLASLDEDTDIEEAWAAETERRISDIESGAVQVIPIADALAQVRASLK
jgi:putative addiction module component (TIGR02574 family)